MITEDDINTVKSIKGLLEPFTPDGVDWEKAHMQDTLDKLVRNLKIAKESYRVASDEDIKNNFFTAECSECDWWGSSKLLEGGSQIADTGDYDDCYCPVCGNTDISELDQYDNNSSTETK